MVFGPMPWTAASLAMLARHAASHLPRDGPAQPHAQIGLGLDALRDEQFGHRLHATELLGVRPLHDLFPAPLAKHGQEA